MGAIIDLANEILWAEDLEMARAAFRRGLMAAGITLYGYGNLKPAGMDHPYVDSTYPPAWLARYLERRYQLIDPVVQEALVNHLPFAWRYVANRDSLTDQQRAFFAEAAGHGLADGYTIPFHDARGCHALVSFAFASTAEMKRVLAAQPDLRLLAVYYHSAVDRLLDTTDPAAMLSTVERQCLEWAAIGRSLWEISAATHRPEEDVAVALRMAREKLGVSTTAQAAEKATALGLIN
ncbi:MAG: LuxR family transcriptional regulator [Pseudomonadota bacterium]